MFLIICNKTIQQILVKSSFRLWLARFKCQRNRVANQFAITIADRAHADQSISPAMESPSHGIWTSTQNPWSLARSFSSSLWRLPKRNPKRIKNKSYTNQTQNSYSSVLCTLLPIKFTFYQNLTLSVYLAEFNSRFQFK